MVTERKLFQGAVILTAAGFISRILGFFFRIFLSHSFGEESVGLYQLIFPLYTLCLSISTAGLQTAVSSLTARKVSLGKADEARNILAIALCLTMVISFLEIIVIQNNAPLIASSFLGDIRCAKLILIISYALPCAAIHSCICGYSFGLQNAKLPAISQLIEQTVRVLTVILIFLAMQNGGWKPSISLAAAGIVAGEFAAALFSARSLSRSRNRFRPVLSRRTAADLRDLVTLSLPLTANRTALTLLQSIEAASIPVCLKLYGLSTADSLSLYGVLTGMALPCILFPSAITNSVGTVLLPAVSATNASGNRASVLKLLKKAVGSCLMLGLACCLFFLIFGRQIGELLFHSATAGRFILTLAWICPFLYTNTALISAINGYGKTGHSFLINMSGLLIRIAGVFLAIPRFGMLGYLWGLLVSQLAVSVLAVAAILFHAPKAQRETL
nr:polysaccharide biosynthesis protein [uncultured Mediterraneibacter sp.]